MIGAFAFTMAVPPILIGNGLGTFVILDLTIRTIANIRNYPYLKNGAMHSVFSLGWIMILVVLAFKFHPGHHR